MWLSRGWFSHHAPLLDKSKTIDKIRTSTSKQCKEKWWNQATWHEPTRFHSVPIDIFRSFWIYRDSFAADIRPLTLVKFYMPGCHKSKIFEFQSIWGLLTYSMVQSPSWEASWFAASQEIPRILWNPKVHYRIHKLPPPVPILGEGFIWYYYVM